VNQQRYRIDAGWIIAFDGSEHRAIRNGSLLIEGDRIAYVGPRSTLAADEVWTLPHDIVSPGFVSLHSHLAFGAVDRSFREDCRSENFYGSTLFEYVLPLMRATTSTTAVALATRLSMIELMRSGVTTSLDIVDGSPEATIAAAEATGIRVVVGETFTSLRRVVRDGVRIDYEPAQEISDEQLLDEVVERALGVADGAEGLVDAVIAPGAVDTCHPELLRRSAIIAREHGLRMTTHCCQSRHEVHENLRRHGETPVELLDRCGFLGPDVILAHCVFIDGHSQVGALRGGRDLELLGRSATTVAHSPTQFARTGSRLEDFVGYRRAGVQIGMAVDAAPQCMLAEMRFAAMLVLHPVSSFG
jgi:cytosine/adenosine deaminase-related metal-dependent hydrolase